MTIPPTRPRPVLVYVSHGASKQAARLLPEGVVLELEVQRAIRSGRVAANSHVGWVFLDEHGIVARVRRTPGRLRPTPRAWTVVRLIECNRKSELGRVGGRPGAGGAVSRSGGCSPVPGR